jgi:hypothetical protein
MLLVMEEEKERKIEREVQWFMCVCVKRFYKGQKLCWSARSEKEKICEPQIVVAYKILVCSWIHSCNYKDTSLLSHPFSSMSSPPFSHFLALQDISTC